MRIVKTILSWWFEGLATSGLAPWIPLPDASTHGDGDEAKETAPPNLPFG